MSLPTGRRGRGAEGAVAALSSAPPTPERAQKAALLRQAGGSERASHTASRRRRWLGMALLAVLVLARLALGTAYALLQPPLESHDETGHSAYVAYVAAHLALPSPGGALTPYFDEGHQPPLYYSIPGLAGHLLSLGGQYQPPMNPFFLSADGSRGVNAAVHLPGVEAAPWHDGLLLLHLARFWSVLLGGAAVLLTWLAGRLALPGRPEVALAGAAIAAFIPTSLGVTDAVTNDALVPVTFGLALVAALAFLRRPGGGRALWLGAAVGLALLTKNSALALLPFALVIIGTGWLRHRAGGLARSGSRLLGWLAVTFGSVAVVAGWWYLRNRLLFGHWITDRSEAATLINAPGVQGKALAYGASGGFVQQLVSYTFRSFWALLGWGTLGAPEWAYRVLLLFSLACFAGLVWLVVRQVRRGAWESSQQAGAVPAPGETGLLLTAPPSSTASGAGWPGVRNADRATAPPVAALPVAAPLPAASVPPLPDWLGAAVLVLVALLMLPEPLYRAIYYEAPTLVPGRYLFGALGAIGLLLALGWSAVTRWLKPLLALPGLGLAVLSLWLLANVVVPAYAAPPPLPAGAAIPDPVDDVFGGRMHLVGYTLSPASVAPGGVVHVTLYWQALRPLDQAYTVGVHVVDGVDGTHSFGQVDSFPGRGNLATPLWQPGRTYADPYDIPIDAATPAPQLGRLLVGVQLQALAPLPTDPLHRSTVAVLPVTDSAGKAVTPFLGRFRIGATPSAPGSAATAPLDRFGADLGLLSTGLTAPAPGTIRVTLRLQALRAPLPRLVVFAHLLRRDGTATNQGQDAEPLDFRYPTDLWLAGEEVGDTLTIRLPPGFPPGRYVVEAGVYDRANGQRLDVTDASGAPLPQQRVLVGMVDLAQ